MAVRNTKAGNNVKDEIVKEVPFAKIDVMELDLSSLASVRKFAAEYNSSGLPLNILMYVVLTYNLRIVPLKLSRLITLIMQNNDASVLFQSNNAGIMAAPFMLSKDNIEMQFATNHVGMFNFT